MEGGTGKERRIERMYRESIPGRQVEALAMMGEAMRNMTPRTIWMSQRGTRTGSFHGWCCGLEGSVGMVTSLLELSRMWVDAG